MRRRSSRHLARERYSCFDHFGDDAQVYGFLAASSAKAVSHYFSATLPQQFDLVMHFDDTRAVESLERIAEWIEGEAPETYPFGV